MKRKTDFGNKPYNRCLECPHRKVSCDGPRTAGLTLARWCEYMRDMKDANGLTNQEISDVSGVSLKTIEKLMAQNSEQDIMRETARRIENAIIGSTSKYPCYLAYQAEHASNQHSQDDVRRELERALGDNQEYRAALDKIHESYKLEMDTIRAEAQRKIDYLMDLVAKLRADNDNLWAENIRKSKIVDKYFERQSNDS